MNIYYYPLACSLFLDNITAKITGDGTLINPAPQGTNLHHTPYPFLRTLPSNGLERNFWGVIDCASNILSDWIDTKLLSAIENAGLASMEREYSNIMAMYYSLLIQNWKTRLQQGDATVGALWTPESVMLGGTESLIFARLRINVFQLFSGTVSTILIILVTVVIIRGHDIHDSVVRDGGVIDMISLLHGSSLPAVVASSTEGESGNRREQAERTYVA